MKALVAVLLLSILSAIAYIFWQSEIRYSFPTPVPKNYIAPTFGEIVELNWPKNKDSKPSLIHFFNPDCPCSRFNLTQFKLLVHKYKRDINFAVVVLDNQTSLGSYNFNKKYSLDLPVSNDPSIAELCGVYSTPQAVVLDKDNKLLYRGNYNKSRYCTDKKTNFVEIVLDSLMKGRNNFDLSPQAYIPYGCTAPNCFY